MKVKELIEKLQKVDPELHVFVHGYEGGYDYVDFNPTEDSVKDIALDVHEEWYYGRHDEAREFPQVKDERIVKGIVL